MISNIDFLIAGVIFLCILLVHFLDQRRFDVNNNRTFLYFLIVGILDLVFDLICTVLISKADPNRAWLLHSCLLVFYLLQVLVSYSLQVHLLVQYSGSPTIGRRNLYLWSIPPIIMALIVVSNLWTGLIYTVNLNGSYVHGPLYSLTYVYTLVYIGAVVASAAVHRRTMGARKFLAVWEVVVIGGACVALQMVCNELLLTGFGLALSITVLYFTMNNPYLNTDSLTGAFDVKYMHERVQTLKIRGGAFHLISVELSQLHQLNLVFGTEVGDRLLVDCVRQLRETGRRNLIFRVSGRRFLLLCFSISCYERALRLIQQGYARERLRGVDSSSCPVLICGIAHAERFDDGSALLDYLEYLSQLVPHCTETSVVQDNEETRRGFRYEQMIEQYLPKAIHDDLFEVCYQPIYSLKRESYESLEALSRLHHPSLGPVSPDVFIRIAEHNDMIAYVDLLQLRRVCRFLQANPSLRKRIRSVKLNLSPIELMKAGHAQALIRVIREHELPTSLFQFEVTETVATEYSENLEEAVQAFVDAGIGLCLDDFGSGFANLNTVLRLPFSTIKLDRSLLKGVSEDERIASFYKNISGMLLNLGYDVVAEGLETEEELELVRQWGVDLIQGFYFSKPIEGKELIALLNGARPTN